MRAIRRMVLEQRLEDIKQSLKVLEYDYANEVETDGVLLGPLTESEYRYHKKCLEAILKDTEKELNR